MEFREIQAKGLERASGAARCCYLKPSGERCGSPAMRGFDLCYYHDRYQPKSGYRNLPCLEDPHSVQCAIQEIIEDMLAGLLDYKKAALALYGLQTAASNLKQMRIAEERLNPARTQRTQRDTECREEETARTVDRVSSTEKGSVGGDRLQPVRNAHENDPASAAEVRVSASDYDALEEIELAAEDEPGLKPADDNAVFTGLKAGAPTEKPTTTDRRPATSLIESPRPPQHVRFGLTGDERKQMKDRFPDLKKIRAEILASLSPEERARVENNL